MTVRRRFGAVGFGIVVVASLIGAVPSGRAAGSGLPEGVLVVSTVSGSARQIGHVYDGGRLLRTLVAPAFTSLTWSPNGKMAAFASSERGVWVERADGSHRRQLVRIKTKCTATCGGPPTVAWAPNGRRLAVGNIDPGTTGFELVNVATGRSTRIGKRQRFVFYSPIGFSPNGRWLAYAFSSGNAGTASCCVEELVVSRANGSHPRVLHKFGDPIHDGPVATWSPDSTRIAFTDDGRDPKDPRLAVVDVRTRRMHALNPYQIYDQFPAWSPDGERLALAQYAGSAFTVAANGGGFRSLNADAGAALWLRNDDVLLAMSAGHLIDLLANGQGTPQPFITLPGNEQLLSFSEAG